MKRLAAALMIAGAGLMAGAATVEATTPDYPPPDITVTPDNPTPGPGETITVTVTECTPGETVEFELEGETASVVCGADGTASASLTVPTAPGTYTGTATLVASNVVVDFTVTVQSAATTTTVSGELPSTGSSSPNRAITMGLLVLLGGAGLYGVAQARRRREITA